ncbi:MAG: Calx-beta domain-containing protein [Gammaproteobacteria bacterium]
MIRITQHRFCSAILGGLLSFSLPLSVQASPLFDGSNNDLWVISPATGRVMGFDFNDWLLSFASGNGPLYQLQSGEQALINTLAQSSIPLTAGQPAISIAGLDAGADGSGSPGFDRLAVEPASGQFENTLAITLKVNTDQLSNTPLILRWNLSGGTGSGQVVLTDDALTGKLPPGGSLAEGYYVQTVYIAKPGQYTLQAQLAINNQPIAEQRRNYEIASNDPDWHRRDVDNDGIPDFIEAAIGLNPFNDDWQFDADGDGWSEFDSWLRTYCLGAGLVIDRQTECLDAEGRPLDTDGDGWSDFDEKVRGTNPEDQQPQLTPIDDETLTSNSYLTRIKRFKDFPVARRLYEVERKLDGFLPVTTDPKLSWTTLYAQSIFGQQLYHSATLLTETEISAAHLSTTKLPTRLIQDNAVADLSENKVPAMRLPAGDSAVLAAYQVSRNPDFIRIYKHWLTAQADISPRSFLASLQKNKAPEITDVNTWQTKFIRFLASQLVINDTGLAITLADTVAVSLLEASLSSEARLISNIRFQILSGLETDIDTDVINQTLNGLRRFGGNDYHFDDLYTHIGLAAVNSFSELATAAQTLLLAGETQSRSDRWVLQQLLDTNKGTAQQRYQLRLLLLPDSISKVTANNQLLNPDLDTDDDASLNALEVQTSLQTLTLPWLADTDNDGSIDGSDECPADPLNLCSLSPNLPTLHIDSQVVISEPVDGQNLALVGITLNRTVEEDVLLFYRADMGNGTATPGSDFEPVTGQVTIRAGSRTAVISIPVLADLAVEELENFFVEISNVNGAILIDNSRTQVSINSVDTPNALLALLVENLLTVQTGETVLLDASPSIDPAGDTLDFIWQQIGDMSIPLVLNTVNDSILQFIAPDVRSIQTLELEVLISNAAGASATTTALVNIQPPLLPSNLHGRLPATVGGTDYQAYYDDELDITWLANANVAGQMSWNAANTWAAGLNINGVTGWRLPLTQPVTGQEFSVNFSNNGTTDNATAATTTDGRDGGWRDTTGKSVSELGHMFYVTLGNTGECVPNGNGIATSCDSPASFGLSNNGPFTHLQTRSFYWSASEFSSLEAWSFANSTGRQLNHFKDQLLFSWAVYSGDVDNLQQTVICDLPPVSTAGRCGNDFIAHSVNDIDRYITSNFGRVRNTNGKWVYKNLRLSGSIGQTGIPLEAVSPCNITVDNGTALTGSDITLHARLNVRLNPSASIDAGGESCLIADKRSVFLKPNAAINADTLAIRANNQVILRYASSLTANGPVELISTGKGKNSQVKIGNSATVTASDVTVKADNQAILAFNSNVSTTGKIDVQSGSLRSSKTVLANRSQVQAGTNLTVSSGRIIRIGAHSMMSAGEILHVNARRDTDCIIAGNAAISYGHKTGTCFSRLP